MGSSKPLIPPATAESMVAKRGTTTTNGAVDGSTVVDAGLTEANDYWNDMTILILSGACDGQSRDITDFAGGTLTVSPVFANQILSGVRYFILPFKPSFAEVEDIKGTGFVKDTDSLVDLSHAGEYDTEMARITADVATEAKQDIIDGIVDNILADTATIAWGDITTIDGLIDDIKAKTDILPAANTDESGSFLWDTSAYTTVEQDISALFSTDLTGTTRRKYAVFVDLTGAEADGAAWTTCTIRVKIGFGVGDAYRTVDKKAIAKTDVAAGEEPGVNIDVPATAKNVQITLQFDVALAADATIYYSYVKEVMEE